MRAAVFVVAVSALMIPCATARAESKPLVSGLSPVRQIVVQQPLLTDDEDTAVDVSGIACLQPMAGTRACLAVNDEDRSARLVTLGDGTLAGGVQIPLIGKQTPKQTFGKAPAGLQCSGGAAPFKDLDGE